MEVPEFLWHCSRDSDIGSDILEVLLSLLLCRRKAPNYRKNDWLFETCFSVNNLVVGNSLRYFNNNKRKSLVAKANMRVFRICVWIWICVSNVRLNNNSCLDCIKEKKECNIGSKIKLYNLLKTGILGRYSIVFNS